jgi:hypothetical protein
MYVVYGKRFWVIVPAILLVSTYTGMVFNLSFESWSYNRILTHLGHFSGWFSRYRVLTEFTSRPLQYEIIHNRLFLLGDVFQHHLFR